MTSPRPLLGQLLVDAKLVPEDALNAVLERQKGDPRRLGALLVEARLVDETQLTQVLSRQLNAPWVSLYHVDFSRQLLNLVPREVAEKFLVIPIYVRNLRRQGNTLYVAMEDPSSEEALLACEQASGLPARAMIASPSDIRNALRVYYGASVTPGAMPDTPARLPAPPAPPEASRPERASSPPPSSEDLPEIEVTELPAPPRGTPPNMIKLTLLDGTVISVPAAHRRRRAADEPVPEGWDVTQPTARDLIAALRAVAQGAESGELLGANARWEPLFAALLSVLLRKHLVADWEFIEALKRI